MLLESEGWSSKSTRKIFTNKIKLISTERKTIVFDLLFMNTIVTYSARLGNKIRKSKVTNYGDVKMGKVK